MGSWDQSDFYSGGGLDAEFYEASQAGFFDAAIDSGLGAVGSGAILGTFDGKTCYATPASGVASLNCSDPKLCQYKCRFAQCANLGQVPNTQCGAGSAGGTTGGGTTGTGGTGGTTGGGTGVTGPGTLVCTQGMVPNAAGTMCVLPGSGVPGGSSPPACTGYFVLNPQTGTCVLSCPAGYVPDSTGTTCVPSASATGTTASTGVLGSIETFIAGNWLWLLIAFGIYEFVLKPKGRR